MEDFFQGASVKLLDYIQYSFRELTQYPQWFVMRKLARFHFVRSWAFACAVRSQQSDYKTFSAFAPTAVEPSVEEVDASLITDCLLSKGMFAGLQLLEPVRQEIVDFAYSSTCYGNKNPKWGFPVKRLEEAQALCDRPILTAGYFNSEQHCPAIKALRQDPNLLAIAAAYLQTTPVHVSSSLWWSFPVKSNILQQSKAAQVFHCDIDDYRFLKFFFYFSDVDNESGPHTYICGSHTKKPLLQQCLRGRATESFLLNYYGRSNVKELCGSSGWGFVEDSFGYHKGAPPRTKPRLMLQIEFAMRDYGTQQDHFEEAQLERLI